MIIIIDNYDSFSYNLYQQIGEAARRNGAEVRVARNDELTTDEIDALDPDAIVLSPGPGRPADAGICEQVVLELGGHIPILGVCLGHQAIVEALGGAVGYAKELMHGKSSMVAIDGKSRLMANMGPTIQVARYHSLAADLDHMPECLMVTAVDDSGEVMAVEHATLPIFGVQFHPESIMTPEGARIVESFLEIASSTRQGTGRQPS